MLKLGKIFFKRVRMSHNRSKSINVPMTGQLFEVEYVEHVHVKKYCDDIFRWDWTEHTYLSSYASKQLFLKVKYLSSLRNHWNYLSSHKWSISIFVLNWRNIPMSNNCTSKILWWRILMPFDRRYPCSRNQTLLSNIVRQWFEWSFDYTEIRKI